MIRLKRMAAGLTDRIEKHGLWLVLTLILLFSGYRARELKIFDPHSGTPAIRMDATEYYGYLPALFIHHDLGFRFLDKPHIPGFSYNYWVKPQPTGKSNTRMTLGYAMVMLPGFILGHAIASVTGALADGFSAPYQFGIWLWVQILVLTGLLALYKVIRSFGISGIIGSLAALAMAFSTNLFNYISFEPGMTHAVNFSLCAFILYGTIRWCETREFRSALLTATSVVMIALIRPTNLVLALMPLVIMHSRGTGLNELLKYWKTTVAAGLIASIPVLLQLIYWKWSTGQWIHDGYTGEHFFFRHWLVPEYLFSFRKGWLLYTPVMILALAGLLDNRLRRMGYSLPVLLIIMFTVWLHSCWWCWWFGGSFGARSMIDFYPILAVPLAFLLDWLKRQATILKLTGMGVMLFLVKLNMHQTRQYQGGVLHWDSMTGEAYRAIFLKDNPPEDFQRMLDPADATKAIKGEIVR